MELLTAVTTAVRAAGDRLHSAAAPPTDGSSLMAAIRANEALVLDVLRPALEAALPGAGWEPDEHATGPVPAGDLWVVDPVGGNVNAVHGLPDWNVGVALVRDGQPVLAAVYSPVDGELFTAVAGNGAHLNGKPIRASVKTDLTTALAGTGQAKPDRSRAAADRVGASITAMLREALVVRFSVPVTHQLTQVAAGRMDLHWQFDNVRSHIGPLLIAAEAGTVVTHLDGSPWRVDGGPYLAAAPGLHAAALAVLGG